MFTMIHQKMSEIIRIPVFLQQIKLKSIFSSVCFHRA